MILEAALATFSRTWTWFEGDWHEGNPGIMGPRSHASWLASMVFDGARVFEGVAPDLGRHAARVNESARKIGLNPTMSTEAIVGLTHEGVKRFDGNVALYVKPMYWGHGEGASTILPDPDDIGFCLCLFEAPLPPAGKGARVTRSRFRRPSLETMPTDAKAGCLYPNNARALREALDRGFDNALVLDMLGNVAETATSNIFMVRGGEVLTPVPNGTFLNGITRQRAIDLLGHTGATVRECALTYEDFLGADEIFMSGNYAKITPVVKIDDRELQPGPVARRARELYWEFAHDTAEAA
ncbi:branched-chain amino acid aminotransferase [Salinarimonas rosea]|uniref:branched-chain amino acid aminotransferase n=1 Tax=Salinarimonas rosea TaxID=552063 RepID=UPI0003F977E2